MISLPALGMATSCIDMLIGDDGQLLRDVVRAFGKAHIPYERARRMEEAHRLDPDLIQAVGAAGFIQPQVPEDYGGAAQLGPDRPNLVQSAIVQEGLAYFDPSVALLVEVSGGLCGGSILKGGTEAQKQEWLPKLAAGEKVGCFALSDSGHGSDVKAMESRAVEGDGGWSISGSKHWITNGMFGDVTIWYAVTIPGETPDKNRHSAFIALPDGYAGRRGYATAPQRNRAIRASGTAGLSAPAGEDSFWVPREALLDGPYKGGTRRNNGFSLSLAVLDYGRVKIAADAIGMMGRALDESVAYADMRGTFTKKIREHGAVAEMLAEMAELYNQARALVYEVAWETDHNDAIDSQRAALAKNTATGNLKRVADLAVQIHGGAGVAEDCIVSKIQDDAKVYPIFEGTFQINRKVIAQGLYPR